MSKPEYISFIREEAGKLRTLVESLQPDNDAMTFMATYSATVSDDDLVAGARQLATWKKIMVLGMVTDKVVEHLGGCTGDKLASTRSLVLHYLQLIADAATEMDEAT